MGLMHVDAMVRMFAIVSFVLAVLSFLLAVVSSEIAIVSVLLDLVFLLFADNDTRVFFLEEVS